MIHVVKVGIDSVFNDEMTSLVHLDFLFNGFLTSMV